jgi:ribonucleoside-diphosphate reductase alpha chain
MCTSIIDYIFRELAVSYLGRTDLAHVMPEDLAPDTTGDADGEGMEPGIDYGDEEIDDERVVTPGPLKLSAPLPKSAAFLASMSKPIVYEDRTYAAAGAAAEPAPETPKRRSGNGNGNGHEHEAEVPANDVRSGRREEIRAAAALSAQVYRAKMQGYEGDACPNCQSFTMVRNGSCLKCDTCGSTSGCS